MFATSKLNIIHVDTANEWRGGQQQLFYLAQGMLERDHIIQVACPASSPLGLRLQNARIPIIPIPNGWSLKGMMILARSKAMLLAAHTSHAHGMCAFLSQPLVVHRRVDFIPRSQWKYRRPKAYICVSDAVKDILTTHVPSVPSLRVYDGVPSLNRTEGVVAPTMSVLCIGACVPHKGHDVLSKAAALIPDVDIWIAGEGPLRFSNLNYLGYRNDISSLMQAAHVIVHPSVEEGLGQVVIEAMMLGANLVVTDAGGLPEAVGDTAVVVPRGDPRSLAAAIKTMLNQPKQVNHAALSRAQEFFTTDVMVEETINAYSSVLQYSNSED